MHCQLQRQGNPKPSRRCPYLGQRDRRRLSGGLGRGRNPAISVICRRWVNSNAELHLAVSATLMIGGSKAPATVVTHSGQVKITENENFPNNEIERKQLSDVERKPRSGPTPVTGLSGMPHAVSCPQAFSADAHFH
jgi:hypothetical protein